MKIRKSILSFCLLTVFYGADSQQNRENISFNFLGTPVIVTDNPFAGLRYIAPLSENSIIDFYKELSSGNISNSSAPFLDIAINTSWMTGFITSSFAEPLNS